MPFLRETTSGMLSFAFSVLWLFITPVLVFVIKQQAGEPEFSLFMAHTLASDRVSLHDAPRGQRFGVCGRVAQQSS
jgi:hypothetical protein